MDYRSNRSGISTMPRRHGTVSRQRGQRRLFPCGARRYKIMRGTGWNASVGPGTASRGGTMRLRSWSGWRGPWAAWSGSPSPAGEPDGSPGADRSIRRDRPQRARPGRADLAGLPQAGVVGRRLSHAPAGSGTSRPPTPTATRPATRRRSGTATACTPPLIPTTACRWACAAGSARDGVKTGLQIDCMVCHGGSIGGKSYVGLGNTQLDLKAAAQRADDRRRPAAAALHLHPQHLARDQQRRHDRRRLAQPAQSGPLVPVLPHAAGRSISPRWTPPPGGT